MWPTPLLWWPELHITSFVACERYFWNVLVPLPYGGVLFIGQHRLSWENGTNHKGVPHSTQSMGLSLQPVQGENGGLYSGKSPREVVGWVPLNWPDSTSRWQQPLNWKFTREASHSSSWGLCHGTDHFWSGFFPDVAFGPFRLFFSFIVVVTFHPLLLELMN